MLKFKFKLNSGEKPEIIITEDKKNNSQLNTPIRNSTNTNTTSLTNSGNYNNNNNSNLNVNYNNVQQNVSGSNDIYFNNMMRMQNVQNYNSPLNTLNDPLGINNFNNTNQRNNVNPHQ